MFDTEKMIKEVEQRPCLWNLSHKLYSDKFMKQKAWQEVAENCFEEWNKWTYEGKGMKLDLLQRKWKSVRDYYMREKKKETEEGSGSAAKRKKSCPYFDLLQFLKVTKVRYSNVTSSENSESDSKNNDRNITDTKNNDRNVTDEKNNDRNLTENKSNDRNVTDEKNNDRNVTGNINDEDIEDQFEPTEMQPASIHQNLPSSSKKIVPEESGLGTRNKTHMTNQESLLRNFDTNDEDPNRYFLLSLMPEMSKMTDRQNFEFRMEVMKSLNKILYKIPE